MLDDVQDPLLTNALLDLVVAEICQPEDAIGERCTQPRKQLLSDQSLVHCSAAVGVSRIPVAATKSACLLPGRIRQGEGSAHIAPA